MGVVAVVPHGLVELAAETIADTVREVESLREVAARGRLDASDLWLETRVGGYVRLSTISELRPRIVLDRDGDAAPSTDPARGEP